MVLESLISPIKAEKKPWELFFFGFLFSSVAIFISIQIFRSQVGIISVFLTVLACVPLMYSTIKLEEEKEEVREAAAAGDPEAMEHEIGDLLFSVVNLARHLKVQPDQALRRANQRFRRRFRFVEAEFGHSASRLQEASLEEMEVAWQKAKSQS